MKIPSRIRSAMSGGLASLALATLLGLFQPAGASAKSLDNFDDNTKTGWDDFNFGLPVGKPVEQNGQFTFTLPPLGQAIFTASRKTTEEFELKEGRTIQMKVDLIEGIGKDSFEIGRAHV